MQILAGFFKTGQVNQVNLFFFVIIQSYYEQQ